MSVSGIISDLYQSIENGTDLDVLREQYKKWISVVDVNQIDRTARKQLEELAAHLGVSYEGDVDYKHNSHVYDPATGMNVPISEESITGSES